MLAFTMLLTFTHEGFAQLLTKDSIDLFIKEVEEKKYPTFEQSLPMLERAVESAKAIKYIPGIIHAQRLTGVLNLDLGNLDKATPALQESIQLAEASGDSLSLAKASFFYADVLLLTEDTQAAISYLESALAYFDQIQDPIWYCNVLTFLGTSYIEDGQGEYGVNLLNQSYQILDSLGHRSRVTPIYNMGYYYLENEDAETALPYIQQAMELHDDLGYCYSLAKDHGNLGLAYYLLGRYEESIAEYTIYLDVGITENYLNFQKKAYEGLYKNYDKLGQHQKALEAYKQYNIYSDSILSNETKEKVSELEIKYETAKKDRELDLQQANIAQLEQQATIDRQQKVLLVGGLFLLLGISWLIYNKQKSDSAKRRELHRLETALMQSKLKQEESEKKRIQNELSYKSKYLTNFALEIAHKNQLADELVDGLKSLRGMPINKQEVKIKELSIMAVSHLRPNDEVKAFQDNVESLNYEFFQKLEQQFPQLTKNERILSGLIRLDIQNKEIASIRNVSNEAIKMARYRLRKKLNLKPEEDIVAFLNNI